MSDLIKLPQANRYIGEMLSGVDIRYDLGEPDPVFGTLVKDQLLMLADGSEQRLYALLEKGGGLWVSPAERALPRGVQPVRIKQGPALLIRPDGCIAWTDASRSSLDDALVRWF